MLVQEGFLYSIELFCLSGPTQALFPHRPIALAQKVFNGWWLRGSPFNETPLALLERAPGEGFLGKHRKEGRLRTFALGEEDR